MTAELEAACAVVKALGVAGVDTIIALNGGGSPAEVLNEPVSASYASVPGFPDVASGRVVVGTYEGTRVAVLEGRPSSAEAAAFALRLPLQVLAQLGARTFVCVTQGVSLQADIYPGSLVAISDHINLSIADPFAALPADVAAAARAIPLRDAYDARLRRRIKAAATSSGVATHEGVHFSLPGAWQETSAEARLARNADADILGFGLAQEVMIARWLNLRVAALAVVTGFAAGIGTSGAKAGAKDANLAGAIGLRRLLRAFLKPFEE